MTEYVGLPRDLIRPISASTFTIDTSGKGLSWPLNPPSTKTVVAVWVNFGTVVGTPSLDLRVETYNVADSRPSGTLAWTNSSANFALSAADSNTWKRIALTASGSFTGGQNTPLHIVLAPPSAGTTPDASNTIIVNRGINTQDGSGGPEASAIASSGLTNTGGRSNLATTWTLSPSVVLEYNDGTYYGGNTGYGSIGSNNVDDIFGVNQAGLRVKLNEPYILQEVFLFQIRTGNPSNPTLTVYDSNLNIVAQNTSQDKDSFNTAGVAYYFRFNGSPVYLKANEVYRIILSGGSSDTSSNKFSLYYLDVLNNNLLPCGGDFHWSKSTNTGVSFTETTTRMPLMQLVLAKAPSRRRIT